MSFKQKGVTVVAADKVGDSAFLYEEAQALSPWIEIKSFRSILAIKVFVGKPGKCRMIPSVVSQYMTLEKAHIWSSRCYAGIGNPFRFRSVIWTVSTGILLGFTRPHVANDHL